MDRRGVCADPRHRKRKGLPYHGDCTRHDRVRSGEYGQGIDVAISAGPIGIRRCRVEQGQQPVLHDREVEHGCRASARGPADLRLEVHAAVRVRFHGRGTRVWFQAEATAQHSGRLPDQKRDSAGAARAVSLRCGQLAQRAEAGRIRRDLSRSRTSCGRRSRPARFRQALRCRPSVTSRPRRAFAGPRCSARSLCSPARGSARSRPPSGGGGWTATRPTRYPSTRP
jgi:hypothetical protein